ncbi:MAG: HNH endonuclease [Actinomycetota bacterium]|nr:HNH endonuclease [Actinomycetota bacterium]
MGTATKTKGSYRIGIDVGDRSVGLAAIEYDKDGMPINLLSVVTHIHDGGKDPSTGKTPQSRLATSGIARRTRRLVANRRRRLQRLDQILTDYGYAVPIGDMPQTYESWMARKHLVEGYVADETERKLLIVSAVRHIARHRGWRNPWWSYETLAKTVAPSTNLIELLDCTATRFEVDRKSLKTLGQVGALSAHRDIPLRPRTGDSRLATKQTPVLTNRIRQEDSLYELQVIFETQQIDAASAKKICEAVFHQDKPRVPIKRVGTDELPGMEAYRRAPRASLEFQEYRIRAAVANLRIRSTKGDSSLTDEQHDLVVDELMRWRFEDRPTWTDVAEWLRIERRELVTATVDESDTWSAPVDRTSEIIERKFKKASQLGAWWRTADRVARADLVAYMTDHSGDESITQIDDAVVEFIETWDEDTLSAVETLNVETGRAAYSRESLVKLNEVMQCERCGYHQARRLAFGVDDDWRPTAARLEDAIEHPAVDRVNTIVRRFLFAAVAQWGLPEEVVIEHVRSAFFGAAAKAEYERDQRANKRHGDLVRAELVDQGVQDPTSSQVRRYESVQRQGSVCLYCGTKIGMLNSELDHIVANKAGGSSRQENLVAVCRTCNAEKGKRAFKDFALLCKRPGVSLEAARERLKLWNRGQMSPRRFSVLKRSVLARMSQSADDEEIDERSMESTAYAARELRGRISTYLATMASRLGMEAPKTAVYRGAITSEARKAGGVDKMLQLRGVPKKSRLDRRHHAIDAAVLTTITPLVGKILGIRSNLQYANRLTGKYPEWKEFNGWGSPDKATFSKWNRQIKACTELIKNAIDNDRVPIVRPLRLRPSVGAIHAATIESLVLKPIAEEFSADEILRIVDRRTFQVLHQSAGGDGMALPPSATRAKDLKDRVALTLDGQVQLFPSNAAYLAARWGACRIGDTVQHARILAWPTGSGYSYGMVRVYTGEFPSIGFSKPHVDILTAPLPSFSQTLRTADSGARRRLQSGEARQIGWVTINDELEIDVAHFVRRTGALAEFLKIMPESRWIITGFFSSDQLSIAPALLAYEGVDDDTEEIVRKTLKDNRIRIAVNVLLGSPGCSIIRRTALGRPRWRSGSLPVSWNVEANARAAFEP